MKGTQWNTTGGAVLSLRKIWEKTLRRMEAAIKVPTLKRTM